METNQSDKVVCEAICDKLNSNDVVLIGESHDSNAYVMHHIANNAEQLAEQGVTTLVMEKFKTSSDASDSINDQAALDAFYASPSRISERLRNKCAIDDRNNGVPEGTLLSNLEKLRKAGIRVVPGESLDNCRNARGEIDTFSEERFNGMSNHVRNQARACIDRGGKAIVIAGLAHNYDVDPRSLENEQRTPRNYSKGILSRCQEDPRLNGKVSCLNIVMKGEWLERCKRNVRDSGIIDGATAIIGGRLVKPSESQAASSRQTNSSAIHMSKLGGSIHKQKPVPTAIHSQDKEELPGVANDLFRAFPKQSNPKQSNPKQSNPKQPNPEQTKSRHRYTSKDEWIQAMYDIIESCTDMVNSGVTLDIVSGICSALSNGINDMTSNEKEEELGTIPTNQSEENDFSDFDTSPESFSNNSASSSLIDFDDNIFDEYNEFANDVNASSSNSNPFNDFEESLKFNF